MWDFGPSCGEQADASRSPVDSAGHMPKCIYTQEHLHLHHDRPLKHPSSQTVIYEINVRGFTIHPSSDVGHPGTYRGLMEKIPYLKKLGVTAVELMPMQEFNEHEVTGINPSTAQHLGNYWGYDPVAFLAPKASYGNAGGLGQQKLEFKEMVRSLHEVGIEAILGVVFQISLSDSRLHPRQEERRPECLQRSVHCHRLFADRSSYIRRHHWCLEKLVPRTMRSRGATHGRWVDRNTLAP